MKLLRRNYPITCTLQHGNHRLFFHAICIPPALSRSTNSSSLTISTPSCCAFCSLLPPPLPARRWVVLPLTWLLVRPPPALTYSIAFDLGLKCSKLPVTHQFSPSNRGGTESSPSMVLSTAVVSNCNPTFFNSSIRCWTSGRENSSIIVAAVFSPIPLISTSFSDSPCSALFTILSIEVKPAPIKSSVTLGPTSGMPNEGNTTRKG